MSNVVVACTRRCPIAGHQRSRFVADNQAPDAEAKASKEKKALQVKEDPYEQACAQARFSSKAHVQKQRVTEQPTIEAA